MMETVFVTPLLLLIAALLIFFGRSAMRMERAAMIDRFEVWRRVENSPGPHGDNSGNPLLNSAFLNNAARTVESVGFGDLPDEPGGAAFSAAVLAHANFQPQTPALADQLVADTDGRRSGGYRVEFAPIAPASIPLDRPFTHRHARIGHNWRSANGWQLDGGTWKPAGPHTNVLPSSRTVFFPTQGEALENAAQAANGQVSARVRNAYLNEPRYVGPEVNFPYPIHDPN